MTDTDIAYYIPTNAVKVDASGKFAYDASGNMYTIEMQPVKINTSKPFSLPFNPVLVAALALAILGTTAVAYGMGANKSQSSQTSPRAAQRAQRAHPELHYSNEPINVPYPERYNTRKSPKDDVALRAIRDDVNKHNHASRVRKNRSRPKPQTGSYRDNLQYVRFKRE